jgi:hypothetical protein
MNKTNMIDKTTKEEFDDFDYKNDIRASLGDETTEKFLDFISTHFTANRVIEAEIEKLEKQNKNVPCLEQHKEPRSITANDYDCSDIHIGRAEAFSDLKNTLTNNKHE